MADGKVSLPYAHFLGYERGEDGSPQIVPEQAAVVRQIYALFLRGKTYNKIAKSLMEQGIPSSAGKETWGVSTVKSILKNEKYAGSALLQKQITVDFLTKKRAKNTGQAPQYFVENSHPAIISPDTFALVQSEIARRAKLGKRLTSANSPFTGKVYCACGALYGTKLWRDHSGKEKVVWQCKGRKRGDCAAPYLSEEQLRQAFVGAYNQLLGDKERYIHALELLCFELTDTKTLDADIAEANQELEIIAGLMQRAIEENAHAALDQSDYQQRYNALRQRFECEKSKQEELTAQCRERIAKRAKIAKFVEDLRRQEHLITDFDEQAWNALAEQITVYSAEKLAVRFRDGTEV